MTRDAEPGCARFATKIWPGPLTAVRFAGAGGLLGGSGFGRCGPSGGGGAAEPAALARRRVILRLAVAPAALLAAVGFLVDRRPRPPGRLLGGDAARLV